MDGWMDGWMDSVLASPLRCLPRYLYYFQSLPVMRPPPAPLPLPTGSDGNAGPDTNATDADALSEELGYLLTCALASVWRKCWTKRSAIQKCIDHSVVGWLEWEGEMPAYMWGCLKAMACPFFPVTKAILETLIRRIGQLG